MLFRFGWHFLSKQSSLVYEFTWQKFREEAIQPLDHIELESGAAEKW